MKAINIYTYSRIQEDMATEYENILSQRSKKLNVKVQEFVAIKTLVDLLLDIDIETKHFENFFASFTIEQIGKENVGLQPTLRILWDCFGGNGKRSHGSIKKPTV